MERGFFVYSTMNFFEVDIYSHHRIQSVPVGLGRPYIISFYEHQEFF